MAIGQLMKKIHSTATLALAIIATLTVSLAQPASAQRRFEVYRSDRFGIPKDSLNPDAVIEFDEFSGEGRIYESDGLGNPDIIEGPKYIIKSEGIFDLPLSINNHKNRDHDCDEDDEDDDDDDDDDNSFGLHRHRHHQR
jgi:hypothetical protein